MGVAGALRCSSRLSFLAIHLYPLDISLSMKGIRLSCILENLFGNVVNKQTNRGLKSGAHLSSSIGILHISLPIAFIHLTHRP